MGRQQGALLITGFACQPLSGYMFLCVYTHCVHIGVHTCMPVHAHSQISSRQFPGGHHVALSSAYQKPLAPDSSPVHWWLFPKGQPWVSFLKHSPLYSFEAGPLIEPRTHNQLDWLASGLHRPPVSTFPVWE